MDPNEALRRARESARKITASDADRVPHAADLADAFEAIDQWLSGGGFLPDDWNEAIDQ